MAQDASPWRRDLPACIGLVSLLLLGAWQEIQAVYAKSMAYFRPTPAGASLLLATALLAIGGAALLYGVAAAVRRRQSARLARLGRSVFLLALGLAAPGAAIAASFPFTGLAATAGLLLDRAWLAAGIAGAIFAARGKDGVFRASRVLTEIVSPLLPVMIASAALAHWSASGTARGGFESATPPGPAFHAGGARVLVLIFDELDSVVAFRNRPASIRLPEFDRLRQETLWADQASAPARCTSQSLPMLLTGRRDLTPAPGEPAIRTGRLDLPERWAGGPNLFAEARAAGARTAIVGWYHPYCGVLGGSVDSCWSAPSTDVTETGRLQEYCRAIGVMACAGHVLRRQAARLIQRVAPRFADPEPLRSEHQALRRWDLERFVQARRRLLELAADASYGLVVAHLSVPHPLGIYDRRAGTLTLSAESNYLDNLELADRTLGEARAAMEQAGLWDTTALIVTSDHGLRPDVWNYRPTWTREEAELSQGREGRSVPFAVKLAIAGPAGQPRYGESINALLTHDLTLELLRGGIRGYEDLRQWIRRNRERTRVDDPPECF